MTLYLQTASGFDPQRFDHWVLLAASVSLCGWIIWKIYIQKVETASSGSQTLSRARRGLLHRVKSTKANRINRQL